MNIFPASRGNAISKEYYYFLKGEINRGTIKKHVTKICLSEKMNYYSYHLTSVM